MGHPCSLLKLLTSLLLSLHLFNVTEAHSAATRYELSNGLTVVLQPDHRAPVVEVQVWYSVGGMDESGGLTGVSHALEHMMFKGAPNTVSGDFNSIMNTLGAFSNAFTSTDYTVFHNSLINNRLPVMLAVEAGRMSHITVREQDFATEHQVILKEWRAGSIDDPEGFADERFMTIAHVISPYRQPVIGWSDDVQSLTAQKVQDWYNQWYHPNNASLVIVGDIDIPETKSLVEKYFSKIPRKILPASLPVRELNEPGERQIKLTHPQAPSLSFWMAFNVPAIKQDDNDWEPYALRMLTGILDEGYSARVETELVRNKNIATSIGAFYHPLGRSDTLLVFYGEPNQTQQVKSEQVIDAIWTLINEIKQTPPSGDELRRVHSQITAQDVFSEDDLSTIAFKLGELTALGLPVEWQENYSKKLKTITPEQIQQVARKYLVPQRLTTGFLNPESVNGKQP